MVIVCYELSDHEALTLHQVKAHDRVAFAASKAFQTGVSLEQLFLPAIGNYMYIFTQFYLKDVAWVDSVLFYMGPVLDCQLIYQ